LEKVGQKLKELEMKLFHWENKSKTYGKSGSEVKENGNVIFPLGKQAYK
jgi:hypothetical protein